MNERIKELLKQATTTLYFGMGERDEIDQEKFVELIVRECADVGSKFSQAHPEDIRYQIKKHFGVEQ